MKKKIIISFDGLTCDTFKDSAHYTRFNEMIDYISEIYGTKDSTRLDDDMYAAAYLIALDPELYAHRTEIISAEKIDNGENPATVLYSEWITEESKQTMRLLLHLWAYGEYGKDLNPAFLAPEMLFNTENSPYYMQAIRLTYPAYNQIQQVTVRARARTCGTERNASQ
ncbi:MAG: hypothetical protein II440_02745 [Clostridia bacterium]|nr:hypothetical protein [Clostridia bacterium]